MNWNLQERFVVRVNDSNELARFDRLVDCLGYSHPFTSCFCFFSRISSKSNYDHLMFALWCDLKDFCWCFKAVHFWHLKIHEYQFEALVAATRCFEVFFELEHSFNSIKCLHTLDLWERLSHQEGQSHHIESVIINTQNRLLAAAQSPQVIRNFYQFLAVSIALF